MLLSVRHPSNNSRTGKPRIMIVARGPRGIVSQWLPVAATVEQIAIATIALIDKYNAKSMQSNVNTVAEYLL